MILNLVGENENKCVSRSKMSEILNAPPILVRSRSSPTKEHVDDIVQFPRMRASLWYENVVFAWCKIISGIALR